MDPEHEPPAGPPGREVSWRFALAGGRRLEIGARPLIAGVINCTPDSFSDGGLYGSPDAAVQAGLDMLRDGADWLDVGGESTRPGSHPVPAAEQLRRILPVIRGLRAATRAPISVDTMDPEVGAAAFEAGADILNDVSGCRNPGWRTVLAGRETPVVLGHMQGTPLDMQVNPEYPGGVTAAVKTHLEERLRALEDWGVPRERSLLDPGLGFGKRLEDNLELIRNIHILRGLGRPVFIGASRKGFIGKVLGPGFLPRPPGADGEAWPGTGGTGADIGTLIVNAIAIFRGANVLRVHHVGHAAALVRMVGSIMGGGARCGS
jgi:dihydropteroate synthase